MSIRHRRRRGRSRPPGPCRPPPRSVTLDAVVEVEVPVHEPQARAALAAVAQRGGGADQQRAVAPDHQWPAALRRGSRRRPLPQLAPRRRRRRRSRSGRSRGRAPRCGSAPRCRRLSAASRRSPTPAAAQRRPARSPRPVPRRRNRAGRRGSSHAPAVRGQPRRYLPLKSGLRFSMKARMPSTRSSVAIASS